MTNTTPTPPPADVTPSSPAPKAKKQSMWKSEIPVITPEQAELNSMIIADAKDRAAAKVTRRTKFLVYQYRAGEEPVIPNGLAVRLGKEIDYILSRNPELQKTVVPIPKGKGPVEVHATDVLTKKQKAGGVTAGALTEGEEGANVAQVKVPFGVRVLRGMYGGYQDLIVLSQKP